MLEPQNLDLDEELFRWPGLEKHPSTYRQWLAAIAEQASREMKLREAHGADTPEPPTEEPPPQPPWDASQRHLVIEAD